MTLVDRSEDLSRLRDEGYDVEVRNGNLLIHHVPYVTSAGIVDRCILLSELTTNGEQTVTPGLHVAHVIGGIPHDHQGKKLTIVIQEGETDHGNGLVANCQLSGKPGGQHPADYHQKMSNYVQVLSQFARAIDPAATHTDFPARETTPEESVFMYHDAASSRSGLSAVTQKLKAGKVAIVGLGGTGSYILDLIAKTPIEEIHLFDDDEFLAHNAFRAPGAAPLEDVRECPKKVEYFATVYGQFRRDIIPHPVKIDGTNVGELHGMSFVFVSMDAGPAKKSILDELRDQDVPFVDCGMGLTRVENSLRGSVRATSGLPGRYDHIERRVSFQDVMADEYNLNMQTADLNMFNAVMAVLRWKKHLGYYVDDRGEANSLYTVAKNSLHNGEYPNGA